MNDEVKEDLAEYKIKQELSESGQEIGVEADTDNLIIEPFDPDSISITQQVVPMDTLIRRLKQKTIRLDPSFQRNEVWDNKRRSRLIESIMLKIPLPMFYVASNEEGRWEVVDGLQRLSTIRNFLLGNEEGEQLVLEDLEFLGPKLDGLTFGQIENDASKQRLVNTIMETEMRFTVINPGTPEAVKRNIFKRINTGGLPLTPQEIRHALYQGQATDLLIELVDSAEFSQAISGNINDTRMGMRELIIYFLAFLILPRDRYKGSVDSWLSSSMRVINAMPDLDQKTLLSIFPDGDIPDIRYSTVDALKSKFTLAMLRAHELFGENAFRKSLPSSGRKTPINKALFEAWSIILSELNQGDYELLLKKKNILYHHYEVLLRGSNQFEEHYAEMLGVPNSSIVFYSEFLTSDDVSKEALEIAIDAERFKTLFDDEYPYDHCYGLLEIPKLMNAELLEDAISRNSSEAESATRRYRLINSMVINIINKSKEEK